MNTYADQGIGKGLRAPLPDLQFRHRHQWFELSDFEWFPPFLRNGVRAFLNAFHRFFEFDRLGAFFIADLLRRTGESRVVELCSGGGEFAARVRTRLVQEYGMDVHFTLTDLRPVPAFPDSNDGGITSLPESVDATRVPPTLSGLRVITGAFHHFPPESARAILADAQKNRVPILILEGNRNSLLAILSSFLYPFLNLAAAPFAKPFRWSHLLLTYVIPVYPIVVSLEGLMSNLRTYSLEEMKELTRGLEGEGYRWEFGINAVPSYPGPVTWMVGYPAGDVRSNTTEARTPALASR